MTLYRTFTIFVYIYYYNNFKTMEHINKIFDKLGYSDYIRLEYTSSIEAIAELRYDTIYINSDYCNIISEIFWTEVILHEVAHYMSPNDNQHGDEFLEACEDVGCEILNVPLMNYELAEELLFEDDFEIYYELN